MLEYLPHYRSYYGDVPFLPVSPAHTLASSMRIPCKRGLWHRCSGDRRSPRKSDRRRWTDQGMARILSLGTIKHGWWQTWLVSNMAGKSRIQPIHGGLKGIFETFVQRSLDSWLLSSTRRVTFTTQEEVRKMLTRGTLEPFKHFY